MKPKKIETETWQDIRKMMSNVSSEESALQWINEVGRQFFPECNFKVSAPMSELTSNVISVAHNNEYLWITPFTTEGENSPRMYVEINDRETTDEVLLVGAAKAKADFIKKGFNVTNNLRNFF